MRVNPTRMQGLLLIEPNIHRDDRGFFQETYNYERYRRAGVSARFVQDNHSFSRRGVLRGLHYQLDYPQAKLIWVSRGAVYDVSLDLRQGSLTFGRWFGVELSAENHRQLFIPEGFAHGFCVLSDEVDLHYKCSAPRDEDDEYGVSWDDPGLEIDWPIDEPILSERDKDFPELAGIPIGLLPRY